MEILNLVLGVLLIICLVYIFKLKTDLEQSEGWQEYEHQEADENRRCYWKDGYLCLNLYKRKNNGEETVRTRIKFNEKTNKVQAFDIRFDGSVHEDSEQFDVEDFPFGWYESEAVIPNEMLQSFRRDVSLAVRAPWLRNESTEEEKQLYKNKINIQNINVDVKSHILKSKYRVDIDKKNTEKKKKNE